MSVSFLNPETDTLDQFLGQETDIMDEGNFLSQCIASSPINLHFSTKIAQKWPEKTKTHILFNMDLVNIVTIILSTVLAPKH